MAKQGRNAAEIQFPQDLLAILKQGHANCVMATFSEEGLPHTSVVHLMYPKGKSSLLMSMDKNTKTYDCMIWRKKVALCFMGKNNMIYNVLCRAGVVKAPSDIHPEMSVVRMETIAIDREPCYLFSIDGGIKASPVNHVSEELRELLMDELETIAGYI